MVLAIPAVVLDDVASFVVVDKVVESVAGFTVDAVVFPIPKVEINDVVTVVVVIGFCTSKKWLLLLYCQCL